MEVQSTFDESYLTNYATPSSRVNQDLSVLLSASASKDLIAPDSGVSSGSAGADVLAVSSGLWSFIWTIFSKLNGFLCVYWK